MAIAPRVPPGRRFVDGMAHAAVRALVAAARVLPEAGRARLADLAGDATRTLLPRRARVAEANLARAFPESDAAWRRSVARDSFRHFARVFFEVFPLSAAELRRVAEGMEVSGIDELRRAVAAGRGAFYVTAHLGNWELMAHALTVRGVPLAVLVRRTKNPGLDALMDRVRTATGNEVIDKDDAVPRIRDVLARGGVVGILMDQNVLGSKAAFVDFLGGRAATSPVVALLAMRHRAPVLAGFTDRLGFGRYRVRIERVWEPGDGVAATPRGKAGTSALTAGISAVLEREIRAAPGTWLWSHERFKTREGRQPRRLAVRMPNWVGDAVMAEPLLRALAAAIPEGEITLLARQPVASLFEACGYDVRVVTRAALGERADPPLDDQLHAVLVLPGSGRAALGARRLRARARVGFDGPWRRALLTHRVPAPPRLVGHQVDRYLALLGPTVLAARAPELPVAPADAVPRLALRDPAALLASVAARGHGVSGGHAVLAPGAAYGSAKRWDADRFVEVGRQAVAAGDVVVLGSSGERGLASRVARGIGAAGPHRVHCLAGGTSLPEAAALLAAARVVIANDSGLMHLAAALGAPVVGLFGATDPAATGPRGSRVEVVRGEAPCSPCRHRECPVGRVCWRRLETPQVLAAMARVAPLPVAAPVGTR